MGKKNSKLKQDTIDRLTTDTYCKYHRNPRVPPSPNPFMFWNGDVARPASQRRFRLGWVRGQFELIAPDITLDVRTGCYGACNETGKRVAGEMKVQNFISLQEKNNAIILIWWIGRPWRAVMFVVNRVCRNQLDNWGNRRATFLSFSGPWYNKLFGSKHYSISTDAENANLYSFVNIFYF